MSDCQTCDPPSNAADTAQQESNNTHDNPIVSSSFVFPETASSTRVIIEFCDRCRWLHRASWVQTELLLTFPPPLIGSITIIPCNTDETAGRFRVWLSLPSTAPIVLWDRKLEGGFPELKILKQRIRDHVQPGKSLGHSDKKS